MQGISWKERESSDGQKYQSFIRWPQAPANFIGQLSGTVYHPVIIQTV